MKHPHLPKSAEAFLTISEVSAELGVPQHVLRFWETKFSQLHPLKRGGGRRYYRPEDVRFLRHIQSLLHMEGYTIKGAQRLLREHHRIGAPPADEGCSEIVDAIPAVTEPAETEKEPGAAKLPEDVRSELSKVLEDLLDLRRLLGKP